MNNQFNNLYHLTNIENCGEILRSGTIRPRIQDLANCTDVEKCAKNQGRFVNFNNCTRSLMLWSIYQGRCRSADKIWGQEDAVQIEIKNACLMVELDLHGDENVILCDCDFSDKRRKAMVLDVSSWEDKGGNLLDVSEINRTVNTIDALEHPKKGAELMIGNEISLCGGMVSAIVVFNARAKYRLLQKKGIPLMYASKVSIRPDWYF